MYQCIATFTTVPRTPWVADEVWAQLDPGAGRLGPRARRALIATILAVLLVITGLVVLKLSGLVRPRVGAWASEVSIDAARHSATITLQLGSGDWVDDPVTAVTPGSPGIAVVSATHPVVPARGDATVTVRLLLDCARVRPGTPVFTLWLHRPWGERPVRVWAPATPGSAHPSEHEVSIFMRGAPWTLCHGDE